MRGNHRAETIALLLALSATCSIGNAQALHTRTDPEALVRELERIRVAYRNSQKELENLYLEGRMSEEWITPCPAKGARFTEPVPSWRKFVYVRRGLRRRLEYEFRPTKGDESQTVYRICDAERIAKVDGYAVYILGLEAFEETWSRVAWPYCHFEALTSMDTGYENLDRAFGKIIGTIRSGAPQFDNSRDVARVTTQEGLLHLEYHRGGVDHPNRWWMDWWLDPQKGYNWVRGSYDIGPGDPLFNIQNERKMEYQELAQGVWAPRSGRILDRIDGENAKKRKGDGIGFFRLEVDRARFGNFDYPDKNFTLEGLPVPVGAKVTDMRHDPPLAYIYGKPPLSLEGMREMGDSTAGNQEVLRRLEEGTWPPPLYAGRDSWLLPWQWVAIGVVNGLVVIGCAIVLVRRWSARAGKRS